MDLTKVLAVGIVAAVSLAQGQGNKQNGVVVRIAELEVDPTQLDSYTLAVKEEIEAAIRLEPGVLAIYSVAEKENPARLRFFEIYASEEAYRSHLASPHFQKYATITKDMIKAKKLIETIPVQLSSKMK